MRPLAKVWNACFGDVLTLCSLEAVEAMSRLRSDDEESSGASEVCLKHLARSARKASKSRDVKTWNKAHSCFELDLRSDSKRCESMGKVLSLRAQRLPGLLASRIGQDLGRRAVPRACFLLNGWFGCRGREAKVLIQEPPAMCADFLEVLTTYTVHDGSTAKYIETRR